MIENDKEFQEVFKKYLKSKGTEGNENYFCGCLSCDDCTLKDVNYGLSDIGVALCSGKPFEKIKKYEKKIKLLKQEIEIMNKWKEENKTLTKEELEEEGKTYAEIYRLIAQMGKMTNEIAKLYNKLDQMEKGKEHD